VTPESVARIRDLAEAGVTALRKAGADDGEARVEESHAALTRFANGAIHQNVAADGTEVGLRALVDGRMGIASGDASTPERLAELADRAVRLARLAPRLEPPAVLAGAREIAPVEGAWSEGAGTSDPEARADGVSRLVAAGAAHGAVGFGSWEEDRATVAIATTNGCSAAERRSRTRVLTVMRHPDGGTGYAEAVGSGPGAIDPGSLGDEAGRWAARGGGATDLGPCDLPVVLGPYAVADLIFTLGLLGFSGLALEEGRSFAVPGTTIGAPGVTIVDDARDPGLLPASFDDEGSPTERVTLVERGVCRAVVHDLGTASRAGRASTGHGLPAPNPWGPVPRHLAMSAGEAAEADLLRPIRRGLYIRRFHYTNPVHPRLALVTGMTRDGCFLVEDGAITRPVRDLRFTQSYLDALVGIEAIGRERRLVAMDPGVVLAPAVRIGSFRFTGATEA